MNIASQIGKMTLADKLQAMELLWEGLCRIPEQVPSPEWHQSVLDEREKGVAQGTSEFLDWQEAKEKIRSAVK
ncbi:MAG: addiction module protein [Desulfurivibrionaceae bacterium]